jgi:hypothetical protein
MIIGDQHVYL